MPGHITGLFKIVDSDKDPLRRGSMGGGFSVEIGTLTEVEAKSAREESCRVTYNGTEIGAPVTKMVVKDLLHSYKSKPLRVSVKHISGLTIGAGFGASGAGALGTAVALGKLVDDSMSLERAGQFAHSAEVRNHTGLGDVIAQTVGGVEVRTKPGAPGIGEARPIEFPEDLTVILAGASGIWTKDVLVDSVKRAHINEVGEQTVRDLLRNPSFENLIESSKAFSTSAGLMTQRVQHATSWLHREGLARSSMVMLGDSVFCFCSEAEIPAAEKILGTLWPQESVARTAVSKLGGRPVE